MRTWNRTTLTAGALLALLGFGCSSDEPTDPGTGGTITTTGGVAGTGGATTGTGGTTTGTGGTTTGTGGATTGTGGTTTGTGGATTGTGGTVAENAKTFAELEAELPALVKEQSVNIAFPEMYSAYIPGSSIAFKVPARIQNDNAEEDDIPTELDSWSALPEGALTFETTADGINMIVASDAPEVLVVYNDGVSGGFAKLHVATGTEAQYMLGETRYTTGPELDLSFLEGGPALEDYATFQEWQAAFDEWLMAQGTAPEDMETDPNLRCTSCHTTGANYFEVQNTPTQAARFSDEDLMSILTTGMKPEGIGFRVLIDDIFPNTTAAEMYADFHTWEAPEEQLQGLILYLRGLTPEGQGDIRLPDGTYVTPGETPAP